MNKYKISLVLNIIIFLLVTLGTVFMMASIRFMGEDIVLTKSKIEAFKFFTVDSNVLMGAIALIFAYYDYSVLKKENKEIPDIVYKLKHIATVGVTLTFLVTVFYLAPFSEYSFFDFFKNSNLFFHLMVPILSIITFVLFEKYSKQQKKVVFLGLVPMIIYAIFYVSSYIIHIGSDSIKDYDWYNLIGNGVIGSLISISIMFALTYLISYTLWYFNKKTSK